MGAGYISAATLDKYGNLWLGTSGDGTFKIPHGSRKAYRVELNNQSFIFDNAHISDLLIDRDGNQWYGCYMKGLFLSNNDKNVFHPVSLDELGAGMETISSVVGVADGLMLLWSKIMGCISWMRRRAIPSYYKVLQDQSKCSRILEECLCIWP